MNRISVLFVLAACFFVLAGCGANAASPSVSIVTPVPAPTEQPSAAPATAEAKAPPVEATKPAPTPSPARTVAAAPPTSGRWIDVDVTNYVVKLMDGTSPVQTISPVAVGAQIDTGIYNSTATGLFHVYSKTAERTYDAPYDTYISNWVGFDPALDNGFHSFLEDKDGKVVDARTGRISNGCIRTGASGTIFAFATIGMPVYVHA